MTDVKGSTTSSRLSTVYIRTINPSADARLGDILETRAAQSAVEEGASVVCSGRRRGLGEEFARAIGACIVEADVARELDAERARPGSRW